MLEREIFDLKTRVSQYRVEIDALNFIISEMKVILNDCSQKAELISRYEEFKSNQQRLSEEFFNYINGNESNIVKIASQVDKSRVDIQELSDSTEDLMNLHNDLSISINSCHQKLERLSLPHEIEKINKVIEDFKKLEEERFCDVFTRLVFPFEAIIASHKEIEEKTEKAICDAEKATKISERIGVEIRILNRKMNEILGKLPL